MDLKKKKGQINTEGLCRSLELWGQTIQKGQYTFAAFITGIDRNAKIQGVINLQKGKYKISRYIIANVQNRNGLEKLQKLRREK